MRIKGGFNNNNHSHINKMPLNLVCYGDLVVMVLFQNVFRITNIIFKS